MKIGMRVTRPETESIPNEKISRREDGVQTRDTTTPMGEETVPTSLEYTSFESFKQTLAASKKPRKKPEPKAKAEKTVHTAPTSAEQPSGDNSQKALDSLSQRQREIFSEMPMDRPVTVDYFTKTGYAMGEVMSALTVLEIKGLISSLPGALYIRK